MTQTEIRAEIYRWLDEDATAPVYWSAVFLNQTIDDGMVEFNRITQQQRSTATITVDATNLYTVPSNSLKITDAWYDTEYHCRMIEDQYLAQLNDEASGTPYYIIEDKRYQSKYRLYPRPTDITKTFELLFVKSPTALTTDTGEPVFRKPHTPLVYYSLFRCYTMAGELQDLQKASEFYGKFIDESNTDGHKTIGDTWRRVKPYGRNSSLRHLDRYERPQG